MAKSGANVFSKQARFQDIGTIPSNAGDLKGWPITKDFLSFVTFEAGHRFLETGEVSGPATNSIECRGPARVANHKDFLSIVNFHAGNLCPILWSTFSRNMRGFRTWEQFHRIQGTCKCGLSQRIFFLSLISSWKFMSNSVVNVFSKQAGFQDLGPIPSNAGDL